MESLDLTFDDLFYHDPDAIRFSSTAEEVVQLALAEEGLKALFCSADEPGEGEERWLVRLKDTAFYPEGGGQPSDRGTLGGRTVLDVQRYPSGIWHLCQGAVEKGALLEGVIDGERRRDFREQHTGEHIVSGLVNKAFGYDNVGFHMNETEMTLDFNGDIDDEALERIEIEANAAVRADLPLEIVVYEEGEADDKDYRSKLELSGKIRLVTVPGVDVCACCGTHCRRTGEVGVIKILRKDAHRGGVRLTVVCGARALADYQTRYKDGRGAGELLSAPSTALAPAVAQLKDQLAAERQRAGRLQRALNEHRLAGIPGNAQNVFCVLDDSDVNNAKYLAKQIAGRVSGVALVFFPHPRTEGHMYLIQSDGGDARAFQQRLQDQLGLRGGGNKGMVQGVTEAQREDIVRRCRAIAWDLNATTLEHETARRDNNADPKVGKANQKGGDHGAV